MIKITIFSIVAWILQDRFFILLFTRSNEKYPVWADNVILITIFHLVLIFSIIIAWQAKGNWKRASQGVMSMTIGLQFGRVVSDFITGIDGTPVSHDTWFGDQVYWVTWSMGWPIFGLLSLILVACLFTIFKLTKKKDSCRE